MAYSISSKSQHVHTTLIELANQPTLTTFKTTFKRLTGTLKGNRKVCKKNESRSCFHAYLKDNEPYMDLSDCKALLNIEAAFSKTFLLRKNPRWTSTQKKIHTLIVRLENKAKKKSEEIEKRWSTLISDQPLGPDSLVHLINDYLPPFSSKGLDELVANPQALKKARIKHMTIEEIEEVFTKPLNPDEIRELFQHASLDQQTQLFKLAKKKFPDDTIFNLFRMISPDLLRLNLESLMSVFGFDETALFDDILKLFPHLTSLRLSHVYLGEYRPYLPSNSAQLNKVTDLDITSSDWGASQQLSDLPKFKIRFGIVGLKTVNFIYKIDVEQIQRSFPHLKITCSAPDSMGDF